MADPVTIGPATLYLGDALSILPGIEDSSIDMVLTDPPYGHNNNNNGDLINRREAALGKFVDRNAENARPIANDGPEANDLFRKILFEARRVLKAPGCCCCCCCGGGGPDPQFARWALWMDEILRFKQAVVWDKGKMGLGWHYRRSYEFILVAEKRGTGKSKWYDRTKKIENIIRRCGVGLDAGIGKIIPAKDQHPTEKPVALGSFFIRLHSAAGDLVLDPMMGSGAFGEAAVRMGRRFIGIELDRRWFDMACRRIERAVTATG